MELTKIIVSGIVGIISGGITAYFTTRLKMKGEKEKWRKEFAQKFAELAVDNPNAAKKISQHFGIGVFVINSTDKKNQGSTKLFMPPNSRLLVGRDKTCDIVIQDITISRSHLTFKSDDDNVFAENIGATTPFTINGKPIGLGNNQKLKSGDLIQIGSSTQINYVDLN